MRALSLWQPWASLVALGVKTIETRSWSTKHRGPLLIHASKRRPVGPEMKRLVADQPAAWAEWFGAGMVAGDGSVDQMPLGAVVAVATLAEVVPIVEGDDVYHDRLRCRTGKAGWVLHGNGGLERWYWDGQQYRHALSEDIEAQRPYGDFTPGRYAWLLTDIHRLPTPVPAKGRQGLWTPDADLITAVEAAR